jgi:ABC-2 type transport system ATP-binding protein
MKKNILEVNHIDFSYGKKRVLNNISFSIKEGTFSVLLGLNGAGKSTIFSLITRLQNLVVGEISINNFPIKDYSNALKDIGIVFQEPTLDLDLTVKQNLY